MNSLGHYANGLNYPNRFFFFFGGRVLDSNSLTSWGQQTVPSDRIKIARNLNITHFAFIINAADTGDFM